MISTTGATLYISARGKRRPPAHREIPEPLLSSSTPERRRRGHSLLDAQRRLEKGCNTTPGGFFFVRMRGVQRPTSVRVVKHAKRFSFFVTLTFSHVCAPFHDSDIAYPLLLFAPFPVLFLLSSSLSHFMSPFSSFSCQQFCATLFKCLFWRSLTFFVESTESIFVRYENENRK